jgi:hypothetical protein
MRNNFPLRADFRIIKYLTQTILHGTISDKVSEYQRISDIFEKMGGSWERLFLGSSPEDMSLLKKIVKIAYKNGYLTKKESLDK